MMVTVSAPALGSVVRLSTAFATATSAERVRGWVHEGEVASAGTFPLGDNNVLLTFFS